MAEWLYQNFSFIILPLHLFSVVIWLGGMVMFVFSIYPSLMQIPNDKMMIRTSYRILRRYFHMLFIFIIFCALTGVVMEIAKHYEDRDPTLSAIVGAKEAIWALMFMIFIFAYYKLNDTKNSCIADDVELAKDNIRLIAHYLFAISIFLGLVSLYFGLILRGA